MQEGGRSEKGGWGRAECCEETWGVNAKLGTELQGTRVECRRYDEPGSADDEIGSRCRAGVFIDPVAMPAPRVHKTHHHYHPAVIMDHGSPSVHTCIYAHLSYQHYPHALGIYTCVRVRPCVRAHARSDCRGVA